MPIAIADTVFTTAESENTRLFALPIAVSVKKKSKKLAVEKGKLMEVKINREIRNYTEAMFFGLSLRQFIFSICACGVAVGLYFVLKPYVGTETVSWMCVLGAAPFAALGFIKYNGMTAEKFIAAWFNCLITSDSEQDIELLRSRFYIRKPK